MRDLFTYMVINDARNKAGEYELQRNVGKSVPRFRRRQRKKGITHVWRQCSLRVRFNPLRYLDQYHWSKRDFFL